MFYGRAIQCLFVVFILQQKSALDKQNMKKTVLPLNNKGSSI